MPPGEERWEGGGDCGEGGTGEGGGGVRGCGGGDGGDGGGEGEAGAGGEGGGGEGGPPPPPLAHFPIAHYRYSGQPTVHVHVGFSPGVAPPASPQTSTVLVDRDCQYRSRWSLLPDMSPAKSWKTM